MKIIKLKKCVKVTQHILKNEYLMHYKAKCYKGFAVSFLKFSVQNNNNNNNNNNNANTTFEVSFYLSFNDLVRKKIEKFKKI